MTDHRQEHADRIREERADVYIEAFDAAIAKQARDYAEEFGEQYRAKHPFKPDTIAAHNAAMEHIKQED